MDTTALVVAVVGALGPILVGLAAWRAAVQARKEVSTNNGRRAGEYIADIGKLAADVQILRIETASKHTQLQADLEGLRDDDRARFAEVDARLDVIEQAVCPPVRQPRASRR